MPVVSWPMRVHDRNSGFQSMTEYKIEAIKQSIK